MRQQLAAAVALFVSAAPVLAHPGHVQEVAGHAHWLALGAISLASVIALGGAVRSLRRHRLEAKSKIAGQE